MARRRRRTIDRSPAHRFALWDAKMDAGVYSVYLERSKPLAAPRFMEYQVAHENIIRIVKNVVSSKPRESVRQHAYTWFAQGIWYATQRYAEDALRVEAEALYMYWYMLDLDPDLMREIASRLGVELPPISDLVLRLARRLGFEFMSEEMVYEGTKRALEETVKPYLSKPDVSMDKVLIQLKYDSNKNISEMTLTDKVTGETITMKFIYDTEGYLVTIDEV